MADSKPPAIPLASDEVIDRYFLEHRAKLIDIAAFIDRVERSEGSSEDDFRLRSLRHAITLRRMFRKCGELVELVAAVN